MLQRVNFVMMIVVLIVLAFVGYQVYQTQRYNTLALQAITSELTKMQYAAKSDATKDLSGALESGANARILVEGSIPNPGWHEISLTTGTTMSDFLRRLDIRPEYWVTHIKAGSSARPMPVLAEDFYNSSSALILRPNDEIRILNEVSVETRRSYFMNQYTTSRIAPCWIARGEHDRVYYVGRLQEPASGPFLYMAQEGGNETYLVSLRPGSRQGLTDLPAEVWDYREGRLILDLAKPDGSGTVPVQNLFDHRLVFDPVSDCRGFQHAYNRAAISNLIEQRAAAMISRAGAFDTMTKEKIGPFLSDALPKLLLEFETNLTQTNAFNEDLRNAARDLFRSHRARFESDPRLKTDEPAVIAPVLREFAVQIVQAAQADVRPLSPAEAIDRIQSRYEFDRYDSETATQIRNSLQRAREHFSASRSPQ